MGALVWLLAVGWFGLYIRGECLREGEKGYREQTAWLDRRAGRKGAVGMGSYRMVYVREHVEVYDENGRFWFSADTREEALRDLEELAA